MNLVLKFFAYALSSASEREREVKQPQISTGVKNEKRENILRFMIII